MTTDWSAELIRLEYPIMSRPADQVVWERSRLADPHRQPDKADRVRAMFDAIAPTYERVNRILSAGRDGYWRRRAVELAAIRPDDRVLDVACGTGDFARAFAKAGPARVVGIDFAERMLALAAARDNGRLRFCRSDALALPFADASFTVVSCAFGVRNFQGLAQGFAEMGRVLSVGGRAVILEFTMPGSWLFGRLYGFYFRSILPRAARWISQDTSGAYDYLPKSVGAFLDAEGMTRALELAGFMNVEHRALTMGVVTVYLARKP